MNALKNLKEYRANRDKYLPLVDHETRYFEERNEFGDVNIGWDCGFIENRPYFLECWATDGITMLTIFISTIGIEDYSTAELEELLIEKGHIFAKKAGYEPPECIPTFEDSNGNEFYSINILVGLEDEPVRIEQRRAILPFELLNELNGYTEENHDGDSAKKPHKKLPYMDVCRIESFRQMLHKYSALKLTERLRPAIKGFPNEETATGVLLYCYIDHEAGITFEILATGRMIGDDGFTVEDIAANVKTDIRAFFRMEAIADEEYIPLDLDEDMQNELFAAKLEILKGYEPSDDIAETRDMDFLDRARDPICIDDIRVLLVKDGLESEACWARIEGLGDHVIIAELLNEPDQDFGCHMGDSIPVSIYKTEEGKFIPYATLGDGE